jgi:hypothetical protein
MEEFQNFSFQHITALYNMELWRIKLCVICYAVNNDCFRKTGRMSVN